MCAAPELRDACGGDSSMLSWEGRVRIMVYREGGRGGRREEVGEGEREGGRSTGIYTIIIIEEREGVGKSKPHYMLACTHQKSQN